MHCLNLRLASLALSVLSPTLIVDALPKLESRQVPANATGITTITSPTGAQIRYKEPELGPCNVTANFTTQLNPYSWSEASNLLFLSQPLGVGFSYSEEELGSLNPFTGEFEPASFGGVDGRWPVINATAIDTTDLAAIATWHVLQGFLSALPQLDATLGPSSTGKTFNLWTESYGGHYGPAFFDYFYQQNQAISNGTINGTYLNFDTLGIGNGIFDEYIQAPYYPEFAVHNTYGIQAVNQTVYDYMKFACFAPQFGCLDQVAACREVNRSTTVGQLYCQQATDQCRTNVEGPYYTFSGRGVYDIRHPYDDPTPPLYFEDYLNLAPVQQAIGVNLNYTDANSDVFYAFELTGDFVYPTFLTDLEYLLNNSVRVNLFYGDADYICNWFGGEAISLAVNYTYATEFRSAGYVPFMVNGAEYGEVRQYGNFSFLRIYEAGHEVPFYQPEASLAMFERVLGNKDIATGDVELTGSYETNGDASATHTEPFAALTSTAIPASSTDVASSAMATSTVVA